MRKRSKTYRMSKSTKSATISIEEAQKNIGLKVQKFRAGNKTPKPFASGRKINTIKDVIIHPVRNVPAYTFYEDDSYVSCAYCVPLPNENEHPISPGSYVKLTSEVYLERETLLFPDALKDHVNFSNAIGKIFIVKKVEPMNGRLFYRIDGGFVFEHVDERVLSINELLIPHKALEPIADIKEYFNHNPKYWLEKGVLKPKNFNDWPHAARMYFVANQTTGVCNCTPVIGESCERCQPLIDKE